MSKCPLQIYLNEKYIDSCASVQPSTRYCNDGIKKTFKDSYTPKYPIPKPEQANVRYDSETRTPKSYCFPSTSALNQYLAQHCKSIEAYRNLQKQQEEVLALCKQKIAQQFPSQLISQLNDEDIIKALRLAESSKYHLIENEKSNELIHAILKVILSGENQQICAHNSRSSDYNVGHKKGSSWEYFNGKRRSVFGKLKNFFLKQNARAHFASSDNYFNSNHNTSAIEINPYPRRFETPIHQYKKKAFKHWMRGWAGDSWFTSSKNLKAGNSSTTSQISEKQKFNAYLAYYYDYKRDVDVLKYAVKQQQNEIKTIQENLNQCLHILQRVENKSNRGVKFMRRDTEAYHYLTDQGYKGFHNPAEPYKRNYRHYRAEGDLSYAPEYGYAQSYTQDPSLSSNATERQKCCGCFKKKKKKNKKDDKQKPPKLEETLPKEAEQLIEEILPKETPPIKQPSQEAPTTIKPILIPPEKKSERPTPKGSDYGTVKSGETGDVATNVQSDDLEPITSTATDTDDSSKKKLCSKCKKKVKKIKDKKRKFKEIKIKKRKPKKVKDKTSSDEVYCERKRCPHRQPCLIRFCKYLFCSGCCI